MEKIYSVKVFDMVKGWPKRGIRVKCHNSAEAMALVKEKLNIPSEKNILINYRIVG